MFLKNYSVIDLRNKQTLSSLLLSV